MQKREMNLFLKSAKFQNLGILQNLIVAGAAVYRALPGVVPVMRGLDYSIAGFWSYTHPGFCRGPFQYDHTI